MDLPNMDDINTEEFINQIERYPAIWNSKCDDYSNRLHKKNAWGSICDNFIKDFKSKNGSEKNSAALTLQNKWRHIRDSYSRQLKKQKNLKSGSAGKNDKKYIYFDQLSFLSELYDAKRSEDSEEKSRDESTASTSTAKTKRSSDTFEDQANTILKVLAERIQQKNHANLDTFEDGDRYFLLSLLNDFKKIPESRKMDAKYEIIGTIRKYAGSNLYTGDYYCNNSHYERSYYTNPSSGSHRQESHQFQSTSNETSDLSPVSNLSANSDVSVYQDLFTDDDPTF